MKIVICMRTLYSLVFLKARLRIELYSQFHHLACIPRSKITDHFRKKNSENQRIMEVVVLLETL